MQKSPAPKRPLASRSPSGREPVGRPSRTASGKGRAERRSHPLLARFFMLMLVWSVTLGPGIGTAAEPRHAHDIGIIIDNRAEPASESSKAAARADIDALLAMFDGQMLIEHIMIFERPEIEVICDIFGCPETIEPHDPSPPLIWQITRAGQARLFVYYIGDGRIEGLERQLLFKRRRDSLQGDVVPISVDWLHGSLEAAEPSLAMMMLDTGFLPRPPACDLDDPQAIDEDLARLRRAFENVMHGHRHQTANFELSATTPVQAAHCDRFDLILDELDQPLFTKFLLRGVVEGEADQEPFGDGDRLVALGELEAFLEDRISRGARFQWGRLQNVRAVGRQGKDLATLDSRELSDLNQDVLERRARQDDGNQESPVIEPPPADEDAVLDDGETSDEGEAGEGEIEDGKIEEGLPEEEGPTETAPADQVMRCLDDPDSEDCHPCVLDPDGQACAERCREDEGSDLCAPDLAVSSEPAITAAAASSELLADTVATVSDSTEPEEERGFVCSLVAETAAPLASTLAQAVGSHIPACAWALDRSDIERGPFARIFTPIGWRLTRSTAQDAAACLLDCSHEMMAGRTSTAGRASTADRATTAGRAPTVQQVDNAPTQAPADPHDFSAFNLEICDRMEEPLPPYIGLPRWMPGALIISETLRAGFGCPPPMETRLPMPLAQTIEAPPETPSEPVVVEDRLRTSEPYSADVDLPPETSEIAPDTGEVLPDPRPAPKPAPAPAAPIETADATPPPENGDGGDQPAPTSSVEGAFADTTGTDLDSDIIASRVRWLQMALTVDNRAPGPIDGALGPRTMAAIQSWRRDQSEDQIQTGPLTEDEFKTIIRKFGDRFDQIFNPVPSF